MRPMILLAECTNQSTSITIFLNAYVIKKLSLMGWFLTVQVANFGVFFLYFHYYLIFFNNLGQAMIITFA